MALIHSLITERMLDFINHANRFWIIFGFLANFSRREWPLSGRDQNQHQSFEEETRVNSFLKGTSRFDAVEPLSSFFFFANIFDRNIVVFCNGAFWISWIESSFSPYLQEGTITFCSKVCWNILTNHDWYAWRRIRAPFWIPRTFVEYDLRRNSALQ